MGGGALVGPGVQSSDLPTGSPPPATTKHDNAGNLKRMSIDLSEYHFPPLCGTCGIKEPTVIAKGCGDEKPSMMCDECLDRGLQVIANYVRLWQKTNKRILVCEKCYRPVFNLDTHLDVRRMVKNGP